MALEWSDVDLENGVIDVNKTLNKRIEINSPKSMASYRQISIDKATILMLKQYKNRQQVKAWELGRSEKLSFQISLVNTLALTTLETNCINILKTLVSLMYVSMVYAIHTQH